MNREWLEKAIRELPHFAALSEEDAKENSSDWLKLIESFKAVTDQYLDNSRQQMQDILMRNSEFPLLFSLSISYHHYLFTYFIEKAGSDKDTERPMFYAGSLMALALEHHVSLYNLMIRGLESSARILFRALIEVYDLVLCVSQDEEFMQNYTKIRMDHEGIDHIIPMKTGSIDRAVNRILHRIDLDPDKFFTKLRKSVYKDLSDFVHVSADTVVMSVMQNHIDNESSSRQFRPGGLHTKTTKTFYLSVLNYSSHFVSLACSNLVKSKYLYFDEDDIQLRAAREALNLGIELQLKWVASLKL